MDKLSESTYLGARRPLLLANQQSPHHHLLVLVVLYPSFPRPLVPERDKRMIRCACLAVFGLGQELQPLKVSFSVISENIYLKNSTQCPTVLLDGWLEVYICEARNSNSAHLFVPPVDRRLMASIFQGGSVHFIRSSQTLSGMRKLRRCRMSSSLLSRAAELARGATPAELKKRNQVYSRFSPAYHALSRGEPRRAVAIAHKLLDQPRRVPTHLRPDFYMHTVKKFIQKGHWNGAYQIYNRMRAENLHGQAEALKLLLQKSVEQRTHINNLDRAIRQIPSTLDRIGEPELIAILAHLIRGKVNPTIIRDFLERSRSKLGKGWKPGWKVCGLMVQAEAQAGYEHEARRWLIRGRREIRSLAKRNPDSALIYKAKQYLYTKLLVGSAAFNPLRPNHFHDIMKVMQQNKIAPTLRIYNILIQHYASAGRANRAFAFYRSMRHSNPSIIPDKNTFHALFSADSSRTFKGDFKWLDLGGRRLFRDMTKQHLSNTNHQPRAESNVLSTAVLNAALRHFMRKHDYAAATITMRTFPVCRIAPNRYTHSAVIDSLIGRVQEELSSNPSERVVTWTDRIVGEIVRLWEGVSMSDITTRLLSTVEKGTRSCKVNGVDLRFLLGLIRRATLAALGRFPGKEPEVDDYVLKRVMHAASKAMLPTKAGNSSHWHRPTAPAPNLR